jgi:hypothetical protein
MRAFESSLPRLPQPHFHFCAVCACLRAAAEWHVGVRASKTGRLVACITGVPAHVQVRPGIEQMGERPCAHGGAPGLRMLLCDAIVRH